MENLDLPNNFDSREQWPKCVHAIRNQAQCGSCWAFGASEALSDRFCIASKADINVVLSPEDMVECDSTDYGCQGGILYFAWNYLETTGVVTDKCLPYTSGAGKVDKCPTKCENGDKFVKYKCEADSVVEATNP
jgi:cathepsin B